MASPDAVRRLIVNADDFGLAHSINQAVIRAHREGILTTASLMVNETAFEEAVALAKENPRLGVGLHLTLICGHSTLSSRHLPGLVDVQRRFSDAPATTGLRYFFDKRLRPQLEDELQAQFARFRATGLTMDHVNGHLHLHLHPVVFQILMKHAGAWGITHLRLTCDPFWLNVRLVSGRWWYRLGHASLFKVLTGWARPALRQQRARHTDRVFGLLQNARVDEAFLTRLLPQLPPGDSELYTHPSLDEFRNEFDALVSPRVQTLLAGQGIRLIRYQDL